MSLVSGGGEASLTSGSSKRTTGAATKAVGGIEMGPKPSRRRREQERRENKCSQKGERGTASTPGGRERRIGWRQRCRIACGLGKKQGADPALTKVWAMFFFLVGVARSPPHPPPSPPSLGAGRHSQHWVLALAVAVGCIRCRRKATTRQTLKFRESETPSPCAYWGRWPLLG